MAARTFVLAACLAGLVACRSPASEVVAKAEQLASADPAVDARLRAPQRSWTPEDGGRLASERLAGKLGKISSRLPETADGEWEVALGAVHRMMLAPRGARSSKPEIDGKRVVYREAYPSTDVIFTSSTEFAEQLLVLRDEHAPSRFTWDVRLPGALRSLRPGEFGSVEIADAKGQAILRIPRPTAIDAKGSKREGVVAWDGRELFVEVDTRGMNFPVLLDPVIEVMGWSRVPLLGSRDFGPAMATLGSTVVLFGGDGNDDEYTWTWDGTSWTAKLTWPRPSPRWYPAMATLGDKIILFGGWDQSRWTALNDTWVTVLKSFLPL